MMTETVKSTNDRKTGFGTYLDVMEALEKQAAAERQHLEEKYARKTQRIYDFHERQLGSAAELRRCAEYVSRHAHALEAILRGASAGEGAPLSASLVPQAAALQACMVQCVANATAMRPLLAATYQHQIDNILTKLESELCSSTSFLQRVVDASYNTDMLMDDLHNTIAEQRRCARALLSAAAADTVGGSTPLAADAELSPRAGSQQACSTPLPRERD